MTEAKAELATIEQVTLDNGIVVQVTRMSESDTLRAATIFDADSIQRITEPGNEDKVTQRDMIDLWRGNEKYMMYIVESSCRLISPLPEDDTWLRRYMRYADLYQIVVDDLVYLEYKEAVYVRHMGMTTPAFVAAVSNFAMGIVPDEAKEAAATTAIAKQKRK